MTGKRFVDGGEECIEDQFLIDTSNDKYYWVSDGLDDIVKLLNDLHEENMLLMKYRNAIWHFDPSKIIRVNKNTGEVDWIDKELKKE